MPTPMTADEHNRLMLRLVELQALMPEVGSPEFEEMQRLEDRLFNLGNELFQEDPDALELIEWQMHDLGLTVDDLVPLLGNKIQAQALLAGHEPLTEQHLRRLSLALDIPFEVLHEASLRESHHHHDHDHHHDHHDDHEHDHD